MGFRYWDTILNRIFYFDKHEIKILNKILSDNDRHDLCERVSAAVDINI